MHVKEYEYVVCQEAALSVVLSSCEKTSFWPKGSWLQLLFSHPFAHIS